jgi:hypothetical protein
LTAIDAAGPAPVGVTETVADVRFSDEKVRACELVVNPANDKPANVTTPAEAVSEVAPLREPDPALIVTEADDDVTVLLCVSVIRTTGCMEN